MHTVPIDAGNAQMSQHPLSVAVTTVRTVSMLWPLKAPPPAPEGSDKLVHFIVFTALAFPMARTGRSG